MESIDTVNAPTESGRTPPGRRCRSGPHEAVVDALNEDGRGVARVDGKVTFIDGALPGERVLYCVEKRKRHYDHAWTVQILESSPERIEPECSYFGVCGGCSLQHMKPGAQIREKEGVLRDKFRQFGKLEAQTWLAPLAGPQWGYRRSARLGVRYVPKKGGVIVGFRERRSTYVTPLQDCPVLDQRVARLLPDLRELIAGVSCFRRLPQVEVVCGDDDAALVFRHLEPFTDADREALAAFGRTRDVRIYHQPGGPDTVSPLWPVRPAPLSYRLPEFHLTIEFEPTQFIQVNADVNRRMVARAVGLLDPKTEDSVLELFCGLGNFTLALARRSGHVLGVEANEALVTAGRRNARVNELGNAEFLRADLYEEPHAQSFWRDRPFDKLLLDPPRGGAMEVLKALPGSGLQRIVYVSCNPATLARDAEYLVNCRGYQMTHAGVMDMFPHTAHVESIAAFEKR